MAHRFVFQRMVEFADTDMAGIMHFANYFRFMEAAEHAFFRSLGLRVHEGGEERAGWVRVHVECTYQAPLAYQDTAEIELLVTGKTDKSINYAFIVRKKRDDSPVDAAVGAMTVVYVKSDATGRIRARAMPRDVAEAIEVAPRELHPKLKAKEPIPNA